MNRNVLAQTSGPLTPLITIGSPREGTVCLHVPLPGENCLHVPLPGKICLHVPLPGAHIWPRSYRSPNVRQFPVALSRWSENGKFPFSAVRARVFFLKQKFSATVIHFPRAEKKQACQEKYPRKQPRIFHAPNFDRACTKSAYPQGCFLSAAENFLVAISNRRKRKFSIFAPS